MVAQSIPHVGATFCHKSLNPVGTRVPDESSLDEGTSPNIIGLPFAVLLPPIAKAIAPCGKA
jgi:hypothetical protein